MKNKEREREKEINRTIHINMKSVLAHGAFIKVYQILMKPKTKMK